MTSFNVLLFTKWEIKKEKKRRIIKFKKQEKKTKNNNNNNNNKGEQNWIGFLSQIFIYLQIKTNRFEEENSSWIYNTHIISLQSSKRKERLNIFPNTGVKQLEHININNSYRGRKGDNWPFFSFFIGGPKAKIITPATRQNIKSKAKQKEEWRWKWWRKEWLSSNLSLNIKHVLRNHHLSPCQQPRDDEKKFF